MQYKVDTYTATIACGLREGYDGPLHLYPEVIKLCREYVDSVGLCVSVSPSAFVYKGGMEPGVMVGLINYPRFPATREKIREHALALAEKMRVALGQHRVSVIFPDETFLLGDIN